MVSKKGFLRVVTLAFSAWFGEWPYSVSLARALVDWLRGGSAFPRIADFNWYYGLTWRVAFYRGGIEPQDFLNGLGIVLIPAVLWIFYEFLRGKT